MVNSTGNGQFLTLISDTWEMVNAEHYIKTDKTIAVIILRTTWNGKCCNVQQFKTGGK